MNRRELIQNISLLLGGSIVGAAVFTSEGCKSTDKQINALFTESQVASLNEIADTILPETSSPGAKAAKVGNFMALMVLDCYEEKNQQIFKEGLKKIDELSKKNHGQSFVKITSGQRTALLIELDREQKTFEDKKEKNSPSHYFRMMKELTLLGYFNSKAGATQALRYVAVPGKFDGSYPYKKGDKAWATT
jgi:hypothetical protein